MSDNNQAAADLVTTVALAEPTCPDCPVDADTTLARRTQRGMVSAEWTVGIIAAIAIAGVLLAVVTAGPVESLLLDVILKIIKAFTRGL